VEVLPKSRFRFGSDQIKSVPEVIYVP
jgi:hypothetical protein